MSARKILTPEQKASILREHLIEKVPVSQICQDNNLQPNTFYQWQLKFFENGAAAFRQEGRGKRQEDDANLKKIAALETKLQQKNEVVAELLQEHVQLKKEFGEL